MKTLLTFAIISCLFVLTFCNEEPIAADKKLELREDFSKSEFKNSLVGEWQSVFKMKNEDNVKFLELSNQETAKITLEKNNAEEEYEGNYTVDFLRLPSKGIVTLGEITIITPKGNIILSSVNFGPHNALHAESGYFLRIDKSPYGVLESIK